MCRIPQTLFMLRHALGLNELLGCMLPRHFTMNPQDLRIDSWPPSASGMHVGMPRGVKIQHKPTGLVVTCDSERSQHKNRDKAMAELIEKLSQLQPNT